jgi:hypothetical protein
MKKFFQCLGTILAGLANLSIIVGVTFAIFTFLNERTKIQADRNQRSADLILRLDDKLDKYQDVIDKLDTDDTKLKLFKSKGGKFTESHVEAYVGIYDLIGELIKHDLLLRTMVYNEYSYDIEKACANEQLMNYISECRKTDCDLYQNFIDLCTTYRKGGTASKAH